MSKSINKLVKNKFRKIPKKNFLSDKSKMGGDIDILDTNFQIRKYFLNNKLFQKSILYIVHHRTGTRYDLTDNNGKLIRLDFLNGKEKNPLFYNISNIEGRKVDTHEIKIKLSDLFLIFLNTIKHIKWRFVGLFQQCPAIIEIFGVDGSGKSYLSKKIYQKLKKIEKVRIAHLWKIDNNKNSNSVIPYQKNVYVLPISFLKEIYIFIRLILMFFSIYVFSKRKTIYIFERSFYDIVLDPSRYCLSHKPIFVRVLHNLFFYNSKKIYLNVSYKLSKKRKNEITKKKYNFLTKRLNYLFKVKFKNSYNFFKKF